MPYQWDSPTPPAPPRAVLHVWPYRSMPKTGFVWFIGVTAVLISLPLFAVLGTLVLWGMLPFILGTLALLWLLIQRNYRDAMILEDLVITAEQITLHRQNPRTAAQAWEANTYWADIHLHPEGGPVPNYLTLKGNGREVELGAFLSEEERLSLFDEVQSALWQFRGAAR